MARAVVPFLMFDGVVENAMRVYISLLTIPESNILNSTDLMNRERKGPFKGRIARRAGVI